MPICEATPFSRAASVSCRASCTSWVSGFSQKTWMPCRMAVMDAGAWVWSGVDTLTESMFPFSLSNISRQSRYSRAPGYFFSAFFRVASSMSHSA